MDGVDVHVSRQPDLDNASPGRLSCAPYHVIFKSTSPRASFEILYTMIEYCEPEGPLLRIKCKNQCRFGVLFASDLDCAAYKESISKARSHPPVERYPFVYAKQEGYKPDGWAVYDEDEENARLGVPNSKWRISTANKDYSLCPTYPKQLIVPADVDDATLVDMAEYRQSARFPVVRYIHPKTRAPLLVASQPLVGPKDERCYEDERMFRSILQAGPNPDKNGYIIDLRSREDAAAIKSKGGGSEQIDHYFGWNPENPADNKRRPVHAELGREPVYVDSLAKFSEACVSTDQGSFLTRADSSGWLHYIKTTLSTAVVVSRILVREALPVVIHATTGCDTELQVLSLAQMFMDAKFRTFDGFRQLIQKEWIDFGHPFESRTSATETNPKTSLPKSVRFASPVFIMFLDCVWQCLQQYPCAFEFNEAFLLALAEHSQASKFGTFQFDCAKDREAAGVAEQTLSFWAFCDLPDELRRFRNVFYEPLAGWIKPSFRPQSIQVWLALYGAGTPYLQFHDEVHELLMFLKDKHDTEKEEIALKQAELDELEAKVKEAGLA
eukprot:m.176171 g.176171  ORF g.176171 m.176171 type:complete len:554 (+) comp14120_c0_seq1:37-1698(+)